MRLLGSMRNLPLTSYTRMRISNLEKDTMKWVLFAAVIPLVGATTNSVAKAAIIPGQSRILVSSSIEGVSQQDEELQPLPTGPLSASVSRIGPVQGSWDLDGEVIFDSPFSATVSLGYVRDDLGSSSFGGDVTFTYDVSFSEPTLVTFDYDVTFTTTSNVIAGGQLHPQNWWAIGGLQMSAGGQTVGFGSDLTFTFPAESSPLTYVGTAAFNVPAGSQQLRVIVPAGTATGDSPGIRSVMATVQVTIIPEPSALMLAGMGLVGVVALVRRRQRQPCTAA